jgi:hypothetical protein
VIAGTYSNAQDNVRVSVAAPGCGFNQGPIVPADSGSSFASPFVAASAWVSQLLDPVAATRMRDRLIMATVPFPQLDNPVESDGLFDPFFLILWPGFGANVVLPGQAPVRPISDIDLEIDIPAGEDGPRVQRTLHMDKKWDGVNAGLVLSEIQGHLFVWLRERNDARPIRGTPTTLRGTIVLQGGATIQVHDPADALTKFRELWF